MAGKKFINGILVSGMGEGAYFMSMPHYQREIKKKLGFDAYPGTLNLMVDAEKYDLLENSNKIVIDGFRQGGKTFGGADCYLAKIRDADGAIIVPHISKHEKNIIEFISPIYLREKFKLGDGDNVTIGLK